MSDPERPCPVIEPMIVRGRLDGAPPAGLVRIGMGFNELPYGPTPRVAAAIADCATSVGRYGSPRCDALRDAIGAANGLSPARIICSNGSEESLDVIARSFVAPGDSIVIPQFGYIQFALTAARVNARLIKAPEANLTTDPEAVLAAIDPSTRLVFLANPNNPTGTAIDTALLDRFVARVPPNVLIVLDLAYGEFVGEGYCADVHAIAAARDNVIVTRTFSKAYGLAGVRVGWAHAPEWVMPTLYAARGMGSVNAIAQAAAVAALTDYPIISARIAEIVSERDRVAAALATMGVVCVPSQANFLLARIDGGSPAMTEALVLHLFDKAGIVVNRTREAGLEEFFRFSLSLPAHNDLLLTTISAFLDDQR